MLSLDAFVFDVACAISFGIALGVFFCLLAK
jgi:hypothetical protein